MRFRIFLSLLRIELRMIDGRVSYNEMKLILSSV